MLGQENFYLTHPPTYKWMLQPICLHMCIIVIIIIAISWKDRNNQ